MSHAMDAFEPLQADDPPLVAGYRIAARLGAGGMGRVYLSHTQGGRPVAIKVVRPELADDPGFRRRFGREIKAARQVRGAYTAELIDADADGVPPWLATLYVPGPSLTEAVTRRGPLPVPAVLWLMAGVAEALQAIHAEGIVHRDLKPSNVLLAADGPRVIDFGIALAADGTSYTATGGTIGTPPFMAPEQASGGDITAATDVFALGQTAAFAALGRPLYGEGSSVGVLYRIVHSEPELSLLPASLRPLFARCLAADPAERATPAEVVEWCRNRLGAEADAGGGPAVWREVAGPEPVVPAPLPEPTRAYPQPLVPPASTPAVPGFPQPPVPVPTPVPGFPQPPVPTPEPRKARRRRTALIAAAGVTGGALMVVALAWTLMDAADRLSDRGADAGGRASASASGAGAGADAGTVVDPSESVPGLTTGSPAGASAGADDTAGGGGGGAPREPRPEDFAQVWLDAKNSLSLAESEPQLKNRKGDIRFGCDANGCELTGDHTVFVQMFKSHGTTLDECRLILKDATSHRWPLASTATGSEICMKDAEGNIGLYVIQTKSTAMPGSAFLLADLTVWRNAGQ
ncbi:serine/threonine-protein kinase [Streptomyces sp. NPDC048565]|uniref:serine/threonine-protein kinase n=1 Tax=Streptomyces sp. NPDC048565 TaxID=3155266 RepID=UPI0034170653